MVELELFKEEYRGDCLRIAAENYDSTRALTLDCELSEMFSNSSFAPKFFVLRKDSVTIGFACYTISWMDYGVFEIGWVNIDRAHQGNRLGEYLVTRIIEELKFKRARVILLFASKAVTLYDRLGFQRLAQFGSDWLMSLSFAHPVYEKYIA